MAELAGRPRDPLGVALGTDRRDLERPGSLDDERPRPHLLAHRPLHGGRLAGQDRLVEPEPGAREQEPVGDDLVAGREPDEVSLHDLGDVKLPRLAVPDDRRLRRHERGQRIELLLGPELLPDSDPGVRDDDPEEEGVAPVPEGQREEAEREQDRVERREACSPGRLPRSSGSPPARGGSRRAARRAAASASDRPAVTGDEAHHRHAARHSGGTTLPFDWARPAISFWRSTVSAAIPSSSQSRVSRTRSELSSSSSCLISGENSKQPGDGERQLGHVCRRRLDLGRGQLDEACEQRQRPLDVLGLGGIVLVVDRLDAPGHERAALGQLDQPEPLAALRRRC